MIFFLRVLFFWMLMSSPGWIVNANEFDEITLPEYRGFIAVSPNSPYFVDEDGRGFIVIGQNDAVPWPGLSTLLNRVSPAATEAYIRDLRAHGVTVSRVMIEYTQEPHTYFENPVGTFSEPIVQFWDDFIALAEAHGLYLLLTPYDTFWQNRNWERYPYSGEIGGPCPTRRDWLRDPACIQAHKERWRFIIERWGASPNIFAWDLMNEIDIWWDATPQEIEAYVTEMAAFVRQTEMEAHGHSRLLTVSSAAPVPQGALGQIIYNHPALDFANTHLYIGENTEPKNTIGSAVVTAGGVVQSRDLIRDERPYFDSETGPINEWIVDVNFDKEYHHNMSWAHLMAGGAGSGMRWPYTTPHWILPELRDNLLGLARYASTINWADFNSININHRVRSNVRNVIDYGISDGHMALLWLLLDTRNNPELTFEGVTITINEVLPDAVYSVEFWETYRGEILHTTEFTAQNGQMSIQLPDFELALKDLALIIRTVQD